MSNAKRIEGIQELIELLNESADRAERIKVAYFDGEHQDANEGFRVVDDLATLQRHLARELADEKKEE